MEYIDLEQWPRKEHFRFFSGLSFPFYTVTVPLDVTELRAYTKTEGLSFNHSLCYVVTKVMSAIPDFLYKIRPDGVVRVPRLHPSFVAMDETTHLFRILNMDLEEGADIKSFCTAARRAEETQKAYFPTAESEVREDFIYFSSVPWFSFTAMSHEMDCNPDDSTPRVTWGKFEERDGRLVLPFNVQFNHRLLDGYHLHLLLEGIRKYQAAL